MPQFGLAPQPLPQPSDMNPTVRPPSGGGTGVTDAAGPPHPDDAPPGGNGSRTRSFAFTYDTPPSVGGPLGPMNIGYVHNVVNSDGQWARGELPDLGYGYAFALRRPRFMREPRTDLGSYNFSRG